jgi:hypothetical protein
MILHEERDCVCLLEPKIIEEARDPGGTLVELCPGDRVTSSRQDDRWIVRPIGGVGRGVVKGRRHEPTAL